jgi:hypothetical protein
MAEEALADRSMDVLRHLERETALARAVLAMLPVVEAARIGHYHGQVRHKVRFVATNSCALCVSFRAFDKALFALAQLDAAQLGDAEETQDG